MKRLLIFVVLLTTSLAQWTLLSNVSQPTYVGSSLNPGPRSFHFMVPDDDPNFFWLGYGLGSINSAYNDVWKYDIQNKQWAWMEGEPEATVFEAAYLSAVNITGSSLRPVPRGGANIWSDSNHIWLYGGQILASVSTFYLADFWKFNLANKTWTWISGPGNNDTEYIPITAFSQQSNSTTPGGLALSITWTHNNTFFMFGGVGFRNVTALIGVSCDYIWSYDPSTQIWTWHGGSPNFSQPIVNYGTLGVPSSLNWPSARVYSGKWFENEILYIFGGLTTSIKGYGNDLWKYEKGIWTWLGGNTYTDPNDVNTVYKDMGYWSDGKIGERYPASYWSHNGQFWLFGGQTITETTNDLWVYDDGKWAWLGPSGATWPSIRNAMSSIEIGDKVYLYGGGSITLDISILSDFWVFDKNYYTILDLPPPPKKVKSYAVAIAVPIVVVAVVAMGAVFGYWQMKRRKFHKTIEVMQNEVELEISTKNRVTFSKHGKTLENVEVESLIGTGNFGEVYQGTWHNTAVALKKLKPEYYPIFKKEADTLLKLRHPQIVQFLGIYSEQNQHFIVMELMNCGDLQKMLQANLEITDEDLLSMAVDAASGLAYIHSNNLIHRDCSLRNLLTSRLASGTKKYTTKISDFGMATLVSETYYQSQNRVLPYKWASVEVIKFGKYSTASDVWAFGVTLWELYSLGVQPYSGLTNAEATDAVLAGKRLSKPDRCPDAVYAIMEKCWQEKTKDRPSMLDVYESLIQLQSRQTMFVASSSTKPEPFYTLEDNNPSTFYKA